MATTETPDSIVLRCDLDWEDVREVMATSRILTLMRQAWTVAGFMFAALLLVCWSALRVWRLSPRHQARHAFASGVWQSGIHQYTLRDEGVYWRAPDGSAVFLPWSALTGVRETRRLFLLLDQEGPEVRGFVPKESSGGLPPDPGLGDLIRQRISAGAP